MSIGSIPKPPGPPPGPPPRKPPPSPPGRLFSLDCLYDSHKRVTMHGDHPTFAIRIHSGKLRVATRALYAASMRGLTSQKARSPFYHNSLWPDLEQPRVEPLCTLTLSDGSIRTSPWTLRYHSSTAALSHEELLPCPSPSRHSSCRALVGCPCLECS